MHVWSIFSFTTEATLASGRTYRLFGKIVRGSDKVRIHLTGVLLQSVIGHGPQEWPLFTYYDAVSTPSYLCFTHALGILLNSGK